MARQVGTTGQTIWMTDDDPDGLVTTVYPEGEPTKVRLLGSVIAMSNGGFRPVAQTAAVGQPLPGDEYLRRRNLWNDPGSGQFKRRGWSSLKAIAARLLDGGLVRDAARERGSVSAQIRNDRFADVGLPADSVVTVRYDDDDFGRVVVTRDNGRTRSYRVPWDQLLPVADEDSSSVPVDRPTEGDGSADTGWQVRSGTTPPTTHSPPTRKAVIPDEPNPAAARAAALQLLEQVGDDPFDVPDGGDDLTEQDRERLEVILDAGMVLLGDLRAAQAAGQQDALATYWSDSEIAKRLAKAERAYRKAEDAFIELQEDLVANVVDATNTQSKPLPLPPFRVADKPGDMGSVDFEDASGEKWSVVPVLDGRNRIQGWKLRRDTGLADDYPIAWQSVARHRFDDVGKALAADRKQVTSAANTLRRRRIDWRTAENEQKIVESARLFPDRQTATDTLVATLNNAVPELFDAIRANVDRPDTDVTGVNAPVGDASRVDKVLAAIGDFDPSRSITIGPVQQRVQIVSVPTVTADGTQRSVQVGLKQSPLGDSVWVTQLVVTDEVNPNRLATVKFNGRPRITAPDTVDAVAKWFEWSYAQRQIDKTTVDTSNTATEEWATAALDAGVEATVEPMTSLTGDKTAAKRVATAARVIPAALVEALNERADRPLRAMAGMRDIGLRSAFSESAYQIKLVNNLDALHEYGHALENRVPALNRMIWAFYQSRTEGDDVYASQRIPGVLTRQDWFFDSYSGRDYGAATQRNPERIGREVFTTGLESLFLGRGGSEQAALDDEHAAFMLGALLLASRPGADGVRIRPSGSTANVGFAKGEDVVFVPGDTTPDVSIDAALMQVMESPEWSDTIGSPFRRRAGRARGQWIETTISDHKMSLGDGERLVVTVEAETNRRNVRREPIIATGERGEGVEVRGGAPTGVASWAIFGADGQIVLSTDPRDELYLKPDETVDEFRERAKQAALEAAMRAKQNDLPSEAELGSMSLAELEALFFALRDNQTVNRNFLYLLRRHIKAKRQGVTIDALEVEAPTVASATAGATIEGLRGRDVLFEEVQTPKGDAWTQAVDTISKEISDEAMTEFADGMTALLIADDKRRQEYFDNAPPEARVFRSYGQLDLSFSDLTGDSGISPGEGVIAATFDPSFDLAGFSKTYSQLVQEEDVIPVTDDRDGYTLWMFWNEHEQVMKVFKVRDTLRRDDGTWELPTQFTDFGGPVGGVNGDDEFGAKRAAVAMMRGAWASSTDSVVVHLMREASLELSGRSQRQLRKSVEDKAEIHNRLSAFDEGVAAIEFMRPLAREVVQAGYANTQQRLKDLGVTEVTVYRGIATYNDLSQGRLVMGDVPLTSWTVDASVAQWFAESRLDQDEYYGGDPLVLVRTIPADQVVGWAKTSIGSEPESEVVLLGHDRADTLIVHTGDADVADFDTILPPRRASISAADEILLIDDNWLRTVRQSRGGATWAALFDGGVVARFSDDEWEVVGPEPERRTVAKMLGEHVENGWPFQFGGWSEDAFAAGIDPEWMKFRLLGSGARFVLGPAGALGSLPVSDPDLIVG